MTKFWRCLLSLSLAAFLQSPLLADDANARKNKPNDRKEHPAAQLPKDITLIDEQKAKLPKRPEVKKPKEKEKG